MDYYIKYLEEVKTFTLKDSSFIVTSNMLSSPLYICPIPSEDAPKTARGFIPMPSSPSSSSLFNKTVEPTSSFVIHVLGVWISSETKLPKNLQGVKDHQKIARDILDHQRLVTEQYEFTISLL